MSVADKAPASQQEPTGPSSGRDISLVDEPRTDLRGMAGRPRPGLGRHIWRLGCAMCISGAGDGLEMVALPLLATTLTRNVFAIALVTALNGISRAACAVPAGLVADRFDRQRLMVVCNLVSAAALGVLLADMSLRHGDLAVVYFVAIALPVSDTLSVIAYQAYVPELAPPGKMAVVNGRLQMADVAGEQVVGPAFGGGLFAIARRAPFFGDALSFVISGVLCWGLPPQARTVSFARVEEERGPGSSGPDRPRLPQRRPGAPRHAKPGWGADLKEGFSAFRQLKTVQLLALVAASMITCFSMVNALFVVYGTRVLHLTSSGYGLFVGAAAVLGVVGSFLGSPVTKRFGPGPTLLGACAAASSSYVLLSFVRNPALAALVWGIQEVGTATGMVALLTVRQRLIPRHLYGRVIGANRLITASAIPLGAMLGGFLASHWGVPAEIRVAGLAELAFLPLVGPSVIRRLAEVDLDLA